MRVLLSPRWMLVALSAVVVFAYWPGLHGGFVFDDYANIVQNSALRVDMRSGAQEWLAAVFSSPASDLQRPLGHARLPGDSEQPGDRLCIVGQLVEPGDEPSRDNHRSAPCRGQIEPLESRAPARFCR